MAIAVFSPLLEYGKRPQMPDCKRPNCCRKTDRLGRPWAINAKQSGIAYLILIQFVTDSRSPPRCEMLHHEKPTLASRIVTRLT